jgi:hypothetical protein
VVSLLGFTGGGCTASAVALPPVAGKVFGSKVPSGPGTVVPTLCVLDTGASFSIPSLPPGSG